jgi:large subunit ribosomal protein L33
LGYSRPAAITRSRSLFYRALSGPLGVLRQNPCYACNPFYRQNGLWSATRPALYNSWFDVGVPARIDSFRGVESRMGKSKKKVETVFLVCDETGDYNYTLRRKSGGEKLKLMKYSRRLRKHTPHTEKKK